jgi:RNA polymerase sigma factor (sigma-70 family)
MGMTAMSGDAAIPVAEEMRGAVVRLQAERGAELWGLARHLGLAPEEADDAVQETLLRLWSALQRGTAVAQPDAWAFRALYRLCMDRHRWRRRVGALRDRLRSEPVRTSLELGERLAVWDAVETLPERQRAAVYLRFRADLPYEQIGEVLGIAAPSARSHVSRALDALRLALGEEETR